MKKTSILMTVFVFLGLLVQSQDRTITGTVTTGMDGSTIPGATIVVKNSTLGTITDLDGVYRITVPESATTLMFSFVGMSTKEVEIGSSNVIDVSLDTDILGLDEVVVTGVASSTPKRKLSVTVDHVSEAKLKEVPAVSAAGMLQGKLAGVKVNNSSGNPGSSPSIRLRGSTSFTGSQAPLIIVDGVMIEGSLSDINVDDIASVEVVKGASASALYGSRAGNGVISVITKRGNKISEGQTKVTIRNEYGLSNLTGSIDITEHHPYELADDYASFTEFTKYKGVIYPDGYVGGSDPNISGNRILSYDQYCDNPFGVIHDHQKDVFKPGAFYTNYVSVASNSGKTNYMASFENSKQEGIIFSTTGYNRQNFRVNVDHWLSDKLKLSTSNLVALSHTDHTDAGNNYTSDEGGGQGSVFFNILMLNPDVNFNLPNSNGQSYMINPDPWSNEENPLYALEFTDRDGYRRNVLNSLALDYYFNDWLTLDANYSMERQNKNFHVYTPKGYLGQQGGYIDGVLFKENFEGISQTLQTTANFNKKFKDFTTKAKLSYLYEKYHRISMQVTGFGLVADNITAIDAINTNDKYLSSYDYLTIAKNVFGILDFDYKDKYIGSFLYRMDGSSLFGENERWQPYFRTSAAYRITEDIKIPGFDELKFRASYGTAGQRPPWRAQYETYDVDNGNLSKFTLGNKDLKPSKSKELEIAIDAEFLNRFNAQFVYSLTNTEDQFVEVPLPAAAGFISQWQNAGNLQSVVYEASLGAKIIETSNLTWVGNVIFDRIRQKITALNSPPFTHGPGANNTDVFWFREGETFGIVEGKKWVDDLSDMANQLPDNGDAISDYGESISDYTINSDGYVILKGTEGTVNESPIGLDRNNDGTVDTDVKIADMNPDFNLGFSSNIRWKNFTAYVLVDWKKGGDIYNLTKQWMYREGLHGDLDQSGKNENEKKSLAYYQTLYNVANINSHFVEDGSYVKLREVSLYYNLDSKKLENTMGGFVKNVKIGLIGRNLLTLTKYSGFDPEVAQGDTDFEDGDDDLSNYAFDGYGYPGFRTITGSILIEF